MLSNAFKRKSSVGYLHTPSLQNRKPSAAPSLRENEAIVGYGPSQKAFGAGSPVQKN